MCTPCHLPPVSKFQLGGACGAASTSRTMTRSNATKPNNALNNFKRKVNRSTSHKYKASNPQPNRLLRTRRRLDRSRSQKCTHAPDDAPRPPVSAKRGQLARERRTSTFSFLAHAAFWIESRSYIYFFAFFCFALLSYSFTTQQLEKESQFHKTCKQAAQHPSLLFTPTCPPTHPPALDICL